MAKCSICGAESSKLIGGKCIQCINIQAMNDEKKTMADINDAGELEINTPIPNFFSMMGSFRRDIKEQEQKNNTKKDKFAHLRKKLGMDKASAEEWEKASGVLEELFKKYGAEINNGTYDIMPLYMFGQDEVRRIFIENFKGIAVYKKDTGEY